ncbi:MAG: hypothetical protein ACD_23C00343G0001, partial [uncultured bacterium]
MFLASSAYTISANSYQNQSTQVSNATAPEKL